MPKFSLELLQSGIPIIFDQVQVSTANHRKNAVALHKLQVNAATVTKAVKGGSAMKLSGEKAFGDAFIDALSRILVVKKGVLVADRVAKFVATFVKFMTEKSAENRPNDEDEEDSPESRLVDRIVKWLLPGFESKDKNIRYRCVQIIGEMISFVGELDESMYLSVRQALMDRTSDKESFVRSVAIVGLSKLLGSEDPSDPPAGPSISHVISHALYYDASSEVRKTALVNLPVTPGVNYLPAILSRSRDVDPLVRRMLYGSVLSTKTVHPRALSISQRETLVKHGLGDREDAVRVSAGKLVASWYEIVTTKDGSAIEFLKLFDVVGPDGAVAADALSSVFASIPEILYGVKFDESFWGELSPESALLARVFVDYSLENQDETRLESSSLPVVTEFAFQIQEIYNSTVELFQHAKMLRSTGEEEDEDEEERDRREDEMLNKAFILSQMLKIAVNLDYADEIGRRKMFKIIRDMLTHALLPEELIDPAMDVLKQLLSSERELVQVVVEIIIELRDPTGDGSGEFIDDSSQVLSRPEKSLKRAATHEALSQEEKTQADAVDLRSLALCISMLKHVNSAFEDNSVLEGIVADVILPAVRRKEYSMRQKGMLGLGLCCLLSKPMSSTSLQLFLSQIQSSPDSLRVQLLQTVFDVFLVHRDLAKFAVEGGILDLLLPLFESEVSEQAQVIICTGLAKMMLYGLVNDDRVLTSLVFAYVSPATTDNEELRQCLAYFLPMYCYSSAINQLRMSSIFLPAFYRVQEAYEQLEDDEEMITPLHFGVLFTDWTNPQKAVSSVEPGNNVEVQNSHVELAIQILRGLYDEDRPVDSKAILCQLIGKVNLPTAINKPSLLKLNILVTNLEDRCPIQDKTAGKAFDRFKARFLKQFADKMAVLEEEGYEVNEDLRELYEHVGLDPPGGEVMSERAGGKSSSPPRQSSTPIIPSRVLKHNGTVSDDDEEEDEDEEKEEDERGASASELDARSVSPEPVQKRKKMPPKHPSPPPSPIESSTSGDQLEEEEPVQNSPLVTPKKNRAVKRLRSPAKHVDLASPVRKKRTQKKPEKDIDAPDVFTVAKPKKKPPAKSARQRKAPSPDSDE